MASLYTALYCFLMMAFGGMSMFLQPSPLHVVAKNEVELEGNDNFGKAPTAAVANSNQLFSHGHTNKDFFDDDGYLKLLDQDARDKAMESTKKMLKAMERKEKEAMKVAVSKLNRSRKLENLWYNARVLVGNKFRQIFGKRNDDDVQQEENEKMKRRALFFLYAKGIVKHMVDEIEENFLYIPPELLDDLLIESFIQFFKYHNPKLERLQRISEPTVDDVVSDSIPSNVQTWDDFCTIIPQWGKKDKSYVFHRDHEKVTREGQPSCLVQRLQKSGLCYLHGPDVLQHYLVAMGTHNPGVAIPMIDLTNYIRQTYDSLALHKHIFKDSGGFSVATLKHMLKAGSEISTINVDSTLSDDKLFEKIKSVFDEYGPILVSHFEVQPEFKDNSRSQYLGKPVEDVVAEDRGHAMVLIGYRNDEGSYRYLLQNWWHQKQFVEVDRAYLEGSNPVLSYVLSVQECIPKELPSTTAFFAETEVDGRDAFLLDA